jgi:hypothetical protein
MSIAVRLTAPDAPGGIPKYGWLILNVGPNQFFTDEESMRIHYPLIQVRAKIKVSSGEYRRFKRECGIQP